MSALRRLFILLSVIVISFYASFLHASQIDLFTYHSFSGNLEKKIQTGVYQINLAKNLFHMALGDELIVNIKGLPKYVFVHDKKTTHANGDITWVAYLKDFGRGYRASLISGKGVLYGRIMTPDGLFIIKKQGNNIFLENIEEKGLILGSTGPDDYLVRDASAISLRQSKRVALMSDDGQSTIDLMILYNHDMANKYPDTSLQTKFNELVALSNQAYIDSNINITLRLVHTEQINYTNTNSNTTALYALTDGTGIFSTVADLRTQYGADLVTFIRPYDNVYHDSCGTAWLNGINGSDISLAAAEGYSVVSDGQNGGWYCDDTTLAHELGHNMGNEHDRDNASYQGAYPYSYGHDRSGYGAFGTIMSYDGPTLNYFSTPDISECNGYPCGIEEGQNNSANNALSMNNTRAKVAAFMDKTVTSENIIYFPHIASNEIWETEICIINNNLISIEGTLKLYDENGDQISSDIRLNLNKHARKEIIVGNELSLPSKIKYIAFETDHENVIGYTKFYISGQSRVAVPSISKITKGDLYVSHIASNKDWWTGISLLNVDSDIKNLSIEFDNGVSKNIILQGREHKKFTIKSLFNNVSQEAIQSAIIKNADGVIGLELFGNGNQLSGILLKNDTANTLYFPHIASNVTWWTGIVAYNPSSESNSLTIKPYSTEGTALSNVIIGLDAYEKYSGTVDALGLPGNSAWFQIQSSNPITGFELFGTNNKNQLAGYTSVNINKSKGVFPKFESEGWTGIGFINIDDSTTTITITAYDNNGTVVATEFLRLNAHEKVKGIAPSLFSTDISSASYISYSSDGGIVGFQLNGSTDGMMLDALPGM